jgi:Fic family protein
MRSFRGDFLQQVPIPLSVVWLISDLAEFKGRQGHFVQQPQLLQALRETALVQSVESSNRIEGITVAPGRLRPLVLDDERPRDRSEEEILGYRRALQEVHLHARDLEVTPELLLRLHGQVQEGAGDAGQWKRVDNEIVEILAGAAPRIRFRPTPAAETPAAVEELCIAYRAVSNRQEIPPLIALAALVFDFLCIHPFRDGNGRVSRLVTLLALYRSGYEVGRYISLERLVEETRGDYYEALRRSSEGWHESRHDLLPWLHYLLSVLRRAYVELEARMEEADSPRGAKTALLEAAIAAFPGDFTLNDLERACPGVSRELARRVLRELRNTGQVECLGRGPGARWRRRKPGP